MTGLTVRQIASETRSDATGRRPSVAQGRSAGIAHRRCISCGGDVDTGSESAFRRGDVLITHDPLTVHWKGVALGLSLTESAIIRRVMLRGRASFQQIDREIEAVGGDPANRSVFLWRIRRKFHDAGVPDLLRTRRGYGLLLSDTRDGSASRALIIGLED